MKKYLYEARIIDEESGEVIRRVFSYSQEGLEEEMGKSKWTDAIKVQKITELLGQEEDNLNN
jgi:hypothetical protein